MMADAKPSIVRSMLSVSVLSISFVILGVFSFSPSPQAAPEKTIALSPEELQTWKRAGFLTQKEILDWAENGFRGEPRVALLWKKMGLEAFDAGFFRSRGLLPEQALQWVSAGFDAWDASGWIDDKFILEDAKAWSDIPNINSRGAQIGIMMGITKETLKLWDISEFEFITDAIIWVGSGFDLESAHHWNKAGFGYNDARDWACKIPRIVWVSSKPVPYDEFYRKYVAENPDAEAPRVARYDHDPDRCSFNLKEAIVWAKDFTDPEEAQQWRFLNKPEEYKEWRLFGEPEKARAWYSGTFSGAEAFQWSFGFTPIAALPWKNAGFDVTNAEFYSRMGYSPSEAKIQQAKDLEEKAHNQAAAAKNKKRRALQDKKCPGGVRSGVYLGSISPYDVKGQCFEFAGKVIQIIGPKSVLVDCSIRGVDIVRLDFEYLSAPPVGSTVANCPYFIDAGSLSICMGINCAAKVPGMIFECGAAVKGQGVFEYVNTLGARQVVSRLKWVRFE